jgi:hypothetical protein
MTKEELFKQQLNDGLSDRSFVGDLNFEKEAEHTKVSFWVNVMNSCSLYPIAVIFDSTKKRVEVRYEFGKPFEDLAKSLKAFISADSFGFDVDDKNGISLSKKYDFDEDGDWVQSLLDDHQQAYNFLLVIFAATPRMNEDIVDSYDYSGD